MATFLVTYHGGGGTPPSPEAQQQMLAAFQTWAASAGDHMLDPGAPLGPPVAVTSDGVADGSASGPIGGYTLLRADSLDEVVGVVKSHPFLSRGGTLQVSETVAP